MIIQKSHVLQPLVAAVFLAVCSCAPPSPKEAYQQKYGAPTVSTMDDYRRQVAQNPDRELVDLRVYLPDAAFDVVYATSGNFMGEPVYTSPSAYLRRLAAVALQAVQAELAEKGYGLKIWDAYRPYRVTVAFYEHVLDSTFAASPTRAPSTTEDARLTLPSSTKRRVRSWPCPPRLMNLRRKPMRSSAICRRMCCRTGDC